MSDYDSIPLDPESTPEGEGPYSNRPADGARRGTPSEFDEGWSGAGEGGDFLGLEADLVEQPGNPYADVPQAAGLELGEVQAPQYATSYASAGEYADEGFGAEHSQDPGFGPDGEAGAEGEAYEEFTPLRTRRGPAGVLISVGLALGMGAAAVVALDYFGLDWMKPTEDVARGPVPAPPGGADRPDTVALESSATPRGDTAPDTSPMPSRTWSEGAGAPPSFGGGDDPLMDTLLAGGEPAQTGSDETGSEVSPTPAGTPAADAGAATPLDTRGWARDGGDPSPLGTVAAWFAPDPEPSLDVPEADPAVADARDTAAPATSPDATEADPNGGPAVARAEPDPPAARRPLVRDTGIVQGPETPDPDAIAMPAEAEGSDLVAERGGTAVFDGLTRGLVITETRAAEDLSKMDVVWRGEEVPVDMIASVAKIWTPQVGPVRVTTKRGEVFEGRLTAVGKRRVWLGGAAGEMALDGDTIERVEHLPDVADTGTPTDLASATGQRVKATSPGGTFEGRVLSVHGTQVTLVTDSGGRITLTEPDIEPVREGIQVKVKMD